MINSLAKAALSALQRNSYNQVVRQSSRTLFIKQIDLQQSNTPLRCDFIEDNLKLQVHTKEDQTIVEAIPCPTGREGRVVHVDESSEACVLCRLNLKNLHYTDVKILSQFIKKNGSIVTYHESNICSKQYRTVVRLIQQAWRCHLIERPANYLVPGPWHDLNTYLEPDRKRDFPMKVIKKQYWRI